MDRRAVASALRAEMVRNPRAPVADATGPQDLCAFLFACSVAWEDISNSPLEPEVVARMSGRIAFEKVAHFFIERPSKSARSDGYLDAYSYLSFAADVSGDARVADACAIAGGSPVFGLVVASFVGKNYSMNEAGMPIFAIECAKIARGMTVTTTTTTTVFSDATLHNTASLESIYTSGKRLAGIPGAFPELPTKFPLPAHVFATRVRALAIRPHEIERELGEVVDVFSVVGDRDTSSLASAKSEVAASFLECHVNWRTWMHRDACAIVLVSEMGDAFLPYLQNVLLHAGPGFSVSSIRSSVTGRGLAHTCASSGAFRLLSYIFEREPSSASAAMSESDWLGMVPWQVGFLWNSARAMRPVANLVVGGTSVILDKNEHTTLRGMQNAVKLLITRGLAPDVALRSITSYQEAKRLAPPPMRGLERRSRRLQAEHIRERPPQVVGNILEVDNPGVAAAADAYDAIVFAFVAWMASSTSCTPRVAGAFETVKNALGRNVGLGRVVVRSIARFVRSLASDGAILPHAVADSRNVKAWLRQYGLEHGPKDVESCRKSAAIACRLILESLPRSGASLGSVAALVSEFALEPVNAAGSFENLIHVTTNSLVAMTIRERVPRRGKPSVDEPPPNSKIYAVPPPRDADDHRGVKRGRSTSDAVAESGAKRRVPGGRVELTVVHASSADPQPLVVEAAHELATLEMAYANAQAAAEAAQNAMHQGVDSLGVESALSGGVYSGMIEKVANLLTSVEEKRASVVAMADTAKVEDVAEAERILQPFGVQLTAADARRGDFGEPEQSYAFAYGPTATLNELGRSINPDDPFAEAYGPPFQQTYGDDEWVPFSAAFPQEEDVWWATQTFADTAQRSGTECNTCNAWVDPPRYSAATVAAGEGQSIRVDFTATVVAGTGHLENSLSWRAEVRIPGSGTVFPGVMLPGQAIVGKGKLRGGSSGDLSGSFAIPQSVLAGGVLAQDITVSVALWSAIKDPKTGRLSRRLRGRATFAVVDLVFGGKNPLRDRIDAATRSVGDFALEREIRANAETQLVVDVDATVEALVSFSQAPPAFAFTTTRKGRLDMVSRRSAEVKEFEHRFRTSGLPSGPPGSIRRSLYPGQPRPYLTMWSLFVPVAAIPVSHGTVRLFEYLIGASFAAMEDKEESEFGPWRKSSSVGASPSESGLAAALGRLLERLVSAGEDGASILAGKVMSHALSSLTRGTLYTRDTTVVSDRYGKERVVGTDTADDCEDTGDDSGIQPAVDCEDGSTGAVRQYDIFMLAWRTGLFEIQSPLLQAMGNALARYSCLFAGVIAQTSGREGGHAIAILAPTESIRTPRTIDERASLALPTFAIDTTCRLDPCISNTPLWERRAAGVINRAFKSLRSLGGDTRGMLNLSTPEYAQVYADTPYCGVGSFYKELFFAVGPDLLRNGVGLGYFRKDGRAEAGVGFASLVGTHAIGEKRIHRLVPMIHVTQSEVDRERTVLSCADMPVCREPSTDDERSESVARSTVFGHIVNQFMLGVNSAYTATLSASTLNVVDSCIPYTMCTEETARGLVSLIMSSNDHGCAMAILTCEATTIHTGTGWFTVRIATIRA